MRDGQLCSSAHTSHSALSFWEQPEIQVFLKFPADGSCGSQLQPEVFWLTLRDDGMNKHLGNNPDGQELWGVLAETPLWPGLGLRGAVGPSAQIWAPAGAGR